MRHAIATVSLSGMLPEKLEAIAAAGFDGVEIFENDLLQFAGKPQDIRKIADDLGLAIDMFQPFRDFDGSTDAQLARSLDRLERKFDLMDELGTSLLLVCSNVQPDALSDIDSLARQFSQLAERAGRRGKRVSYEALAWGGKIQRFSQAWEVVSRVDHPSLGLTLDSFHTLALRDDPRPIAQLPGHRIFYVQLADAPWINTDILSHSRHFRCFPGQGELDVTGFLRAVLDSGYSDTLSLEIFNDDFRAAPTRAYALDAMRSLLWLEEQAELERQSSDTRRFTFSEPAAHGPPPSPPHLEGWAFIEFAVEAATASRLIPMLATLGFERIGRHRSKDVELYGFGDVRIVLNLETDSFARRWFDLHGTSACALALQSSNPSQSLDRAEALGWQPVRGRAAEDELSIPAVRLPDGSSLYFCGSAADGRPDFESDFVMETQTTHGARIDHIVHAIPSGQVDPWVLFHRAVLGLKLQRNVLLNDPFGVIRSREIESVDQAVRIGLTVSERNDTVVARSVSRYGGAGVQQIAIEVSDLKATVSGLKQCGAKLLPIPDNYYDDLATRYELAPEFIDDIRDNGLLYERHAQGEFLHVYAVPFEDRFEFEFIERRNGYALYGSTNAPAHLAALAQWRSADATRDMNVD